MISITSVSIARPIEPIAAESVRPADTGATVPSGEPQSNLMASISPPGGLHPVADGPSTGVFGFISDAARAAIAKSNEPKSSDPAPSSGGGSPCPHGAVPRPRYGCIFGSF